MHASALALVRDRELAIEHEAGDGEFDREGHEHGRGIVYPERSGERDAEVGVPVDV